MAGAWVFGYGSLVNLRSLSKALAREVAASELRPAWLHGFRRAWIASELVIAAGHEGGVLARFFDLEAAPAARVNGAIVQVTDAELAALTTREKSYDRLDVSAAISGAPSGATIVTFVGRVARPGAITLRAYVALVEEGFAALGAAHLADFRADLTLPPPVVDGPYRFVDEAQNARTTWAHGAT